VDDIWLKRLPLSCDTAGNTPIEAGRERATRVIVSIAVISTIDLRKSSASFSELVHSRMIWYPHQDFMAAVGQPLTEIVKEDLASATRP
jgi:hypothetical protein